MLTTRLEQFFKLELQQYELEWIFDLPVIHADLLRKQSCVISGMFELSYNFCYG